MIPVSIEYLVHEKEGAVARPVKGEIRIHFTIER
jgi:hypothetical protein